ncbi:hypothetical protein A2U01_0008463, partial [Trifolium medium]|nr:hypothetical protein [Trifolium medium]
YEKLPQMCFKCGMIGHSDKLCRNQALVLDTLAPLGPWIRSTQYGRRKMEDKDRKYYSNPSHAKNFGQYSPPVPTDLLEKLAAMRVQPTTETPHQQHTHQPSSQYHNPQQTDQIPMDSIQCQIEETGKKSHRISYNQELATMNNTTENSPKEQPIKRQKMEENQRVGTARQASPRQ